MPAFSISIAFCKVINSPFETRISPYSSIISLAAYFSLILPLIANFLLNVYLPALDRSYLFGSKNKLLSNEVAASTDAGSPGLSFL